MDLRGLKKKGFVSPSPHHRFVNVNIARVRVSFLILVFATRFARVSYPGNTLFWLDILDFGATWVGLGIGFLFVRTDGKENIDSKRGFLPPHHFWKRFGYDELEYTISSVSL